MQGWVFLQTAATLSGPRTIYQQTQNQYLTLLALLSQAQLLAVTVNPISVQSPHFPQLLATAILFPEHQAFVWCLHGHLIYSLQFSPRPADAPSPGWHQWIHQDPKSICQPERHGCLFQVFSLLPGGYSLALEILTWRANQHLLPCF